MSILQTSTIKMSSYFFIYFLYSVEEGTVVENIKSDVATLRIVTTMQK